MADLVSIIMPSFNTAEYIAQTLDCVLAQTYTNWELVIVDDCSTDDTDAVVARYQDQRIRYFKNEKNSGAAVRSFVYTKSHPSGRPGAGGSRFWTATTFGHRTSWKSRSGS